MPGSRVTLLSTLPSTAEKYCRWYAHFCACGKMLDARLEQPFLLPGSRVTLLSTLPLTVEKCCRSYAHFCACGKMLDARLEQLGGKRFSGRADVNREDWKAVDAWIQAAVADLDGLELAAHSNTAGAFIIRG